MTDPRDTSPAPREGKNDRAAGTDDTVAQPGSLGSARTVAQVPEELAEAQTIADARSGEPSGRPAVMTGQGVTLPVHASGGATLAMLDTSRYTLGSLLGKGGMGEVVLAFDEQIGREVAVKRIRSTAPSAEELSRFLREARVQGRLQHPAVVPVHDLAFDKEGRPYFVMKRLAGTTLGELIGKLRDGDEPDPDAARRRLLRAFVDVCLAVEFAHSVGIVHRDLKPANIMLGDFGEVYVLDWGVARALTDGDDGTAVGQESGLGLDSGETRAGTVLGTPAYMAPEQLAGDRAGPAADVYALGCILYEIACGRILHDGARNLASVLKPVDAAPSRVRPDSPPELDSICERATQLEAEARFASARALGDAVQAYLDGDRDLAVRKELAQQHLATARAAIARGDDERDRTEAVRAAGRALALDPTCADAADVLTRLMLEPPKETPAEVVRQLQHLETETARTQGKLAATSMIGYLAFVPLLLWTGVRDLTFVLALIALALASGVQLWTLTRRENRIKHGAIYANACINAMLIGLVCRMVGPFIIAPTLVTTTLMAYAAHPGLGSIRVTASILTAAVAVPWLLELAGVLSPTYRFTEGGELVLSSSVLHFSAVPVQLAFAMLLVALVAVVALLVRGIAQRQVQATHALELQAWHLRQLVPTRATR